ncbi:hypothetical protein [Cupriavidus necator]|nr:hypothetical protein [Cupriavidus necator]
MRGELLVWLDLIETACGRDDDALAVSVCVDARYFAAVLLDRVGGLMGAW